MGKRHEKHADGYYHIHDNKYKLIRGSRAQVIHGTAYKTDGTPGLKKENLRYNKSKKIVSKHKSDKAKIDNRLEKHGYYAKKGKFGAVRKNGKSVKKRSSHKNKRPKNKTHKKT